MGCIERLPLFGAARAFALLQALHPSFAFSVPEHARLLGVSRRNLERWFQGPDICSAGCLQSVCAAAEARSDRPPEWIEHPGYGVLDIDSVRPAVEHARAGTAPQRGAGGGVQVHHAARGVEHVHRVAHALFEAEVPLDQVTWEGRPHIKPEE